LALCCHSLISVFANNLCIGYSSFFQHQTLFNDTAGAQQTVYKSHTVLNLHVIHDDTVLKFDIRAESHIATDNGLRNGAGLVFEFNRLVDQTAVADPFNERNCLLLILLLLKLQRHAFG